MTLAEVTKDNVSEVGIFCIKDKKADGFKKKIEWYKNKFNEGLQIILVIDSNQKEIGFIEFLPSESSWRPVLAQNYMFIQCIALFTKKSRNQSIGSQLISFCESKAKEANMDGVCVMTSSGPWMANKTIFEKNNYHKVDEKDRFELMSKSFNDKASLPSFVDWDQNLKIYNGWNLVYSDQCPWHDKSVKALANTSRKYNIDLMVTQLKSPLDAQQAPSGFGTFSLIRDGRLLADHYISNTRFENILKKELNQ